MDRLRAMDSLLEKLRAAAPQTRDQRDRRRRARVSSPTTRDDAKLESRLTRDDAELERVLRRDDAQLKRQLRRRARRERLKDSHQAGVASEQSIQEINEFPDSDTGLMSAKSVDISAIDGTMETGSVGGNLLSPTSSPSPSFDGDTIRQVSNRCLHLFLENLDNAKSLNEPETNEQTQSTLQDELMRFKLWGSNIGVFADVHASLDFRLRELPDISELFLRQLDTIEERLEQVSQMSLYLGLENDVEIYGHGSRYECPECGLVFALPSDTQKHLETVHSIYHTRDPESSDHEVDTEEPFDDWSRPELIQSIHESIDWLHRLSNMVRKASFNNQNKRADNFMLRDDNGEKSEELTRSLLEGLTQLYQFYIRTHAAGVGERLAQRLVQTMIIRHRRILYRRARRKVWTLEHIDYSPRKIEQKSHPLGVSLPEPETAAPSDGRKPGLLQPTARTEMAGSQVTATTVDIKMLRKAFAPSEVSKATSNSLIVSDRLLVPPRPAAAKSGIEFVCDYCGLLLPAREASNAALWAKHIRKDLDPYVCVFDECDTPFEIYSSSREWLSHMRTQHRMRWHCFATSHEPSFFQTPDGLEEHLRGTHADHFSSEEISFLVENSSHPSISVIEHCPFCQETAENTEQHVARHLIQFALRSLPWPEDCYSNYHPSQTSRSAHSEGTVSSEGTIRDVEGTLQVRKTDWDAWEKEIHDGRKSLKSQRGDEPPLTDERSDVVGLRDFIPPNYDATEDELLEPFRKRANIDVAKDLSPETQLSKRQASVRNLIKEEATFVRDLNVLVLIYKETLEAVPKVNQSTADRLFRNLGQVLALHEEFLKDLKIAVQPESEGARPSPRDDPVSLAPGLIGTVILENFRRLGPAHEAYSITHEDAISLWQSIREEPTIRMWMDECNRAASDLTNRKFDDLLELSNRRYRSEYYATWLNRISTQTPDDHPDKEHLLAAVAYHRSSVFRAESTKKRNEIVQRVLANGDSGGSLLGKVFKSQDNTEDNSLDDADFTKLRERFSDDYLRLQVTLRDCESHTRVVAAYYHYFKDLSSSMDLLMRVEASPFPEIQSKWTQFSFGFSKKEDWIMKSYIGRLREQVFEPMENLSQLHARAALLIDHRRNRHQNFEKYKLLKRNGKKPGDQLARISEEFEAIDSALRQELPLFHNLVVKLMRLLTEQLALAQTQWFSKWTTVFKSLASMVEVPELEDIMADFQRDFEYMEEQAEELAIIGSPQRRNSNFRTQSLPIRPPSPPIPIRPASPPHAAGPPQPTWVDRGYYYPGHTSRSPYAPAISGDGDHPGPSRPKYNTMWMAASLFEFNIETTKHDGGYPYLTYQAGEIFDVIAEKGEFWLAENQDDPSGLVGWIWSKHFAKLADS